MSEPISLTEAYYQMSERAYDMTKHIYNCPECGNGFTVDHQDDRVYEDPCPHCCYRYPNLIELTDGDDD